MFSVTRTVCQQVHGGIWVSGGGDYAGENTKITVKQWRRFRRVG